MQIELEANESWANFFLLPAIGDHDKNLLGQEDRREARYGVGGGGVCVQQKDEVEEVP